MMMVSVFCETIGYLKILRETSFRTPKDTERKKIKEKEGEKEWEEVFVFVFVFVSLVYSS